MTDHQHPLTDEMIESISCFYLSKWGDTSEGIKQDMRAAYDKGSTDMLDKVLKWLNETIFEQSLHDADDLPEELREAMRPQEQS